jgi:hypothetical protein
MLRKLFVLFFFVIPLPLVAETPAYVQKVIPDAQPVGSGQLSYLVWDVYDATLYAPDGVWTDIPPYALKLDYLMDLEGDDIAERSITEMRGQGFNDETKLIAWESEMKSIFPNVSKGTSLTGIYDENGITTFYQNGNLIGRIEDSEFGKRFFDIWLHPKTSEPSLRAQLIGS